MTRLGAALLLALCVGSWAHAAPARWQDLSAAQRTALAPLQASWANMDNARRDKWLEVAGRFPQLSPAEQQRMQTRMSEWARRSPTERGQARLQFQEAQAWTPEERQERWEAYQSLDPQARQVLAERWKLEEAARPKAHTPAAPADKRNVIEASKPTAVPRQTATPTAVRAGSGATTRPMSTPRAEPPHHHTGQPKIAATPSFVDPATLLPRRGPQAAAVSAQPAASAPSRQR